MKKAQLSIVLVLFVAFLTSCSSKDGVEPSEELQEIRRIRFCMEPMEQEELFSRLTTNDDVSVYTYQKNDTLGIFPTQGGQVEFPIVEESSSIAEFDGGGWALKAQHSYSAYYPFNFYNRKPKEVPFSYVGQERDGDVTDERAHLRNYLFLAAPPETADGEGALTFHARHQGSILKLTLTVPEVGNYTSLIVYTDTVVIPIRKTIDLTSSSLPHTVKEYSDRVKISLKNVFTTSANEEMVVWMAFPSMTEDSCSLKAALINSGGKAYTGNVKNSTGVQAFASFTAHKWQRRFVTLEYNPNFNLGINTVTPEAWENGGGEDVTVAIP